MAKKANKLVKRIEALQDELNKITREVDEHDDGHVNVAAEILESCNELLGSAVQLIETHG